MKKIISLFQRNYDGDRLVRDEIVPGSEWVRDGEGWATRKYDGTCCMVKEGKLYKRFDCKEGKIPPPGFIPAQDPDPVTKHWPGWLECEPTNPNDKWFLEGFSNISTWKDPPQDGTYELCGPKIQGNPEKFENHVLMAHDLMEKLEAPRDFNGIKEFLKDLNIEGIVWHHPDGRMVKIKKKDFGFKRNGQ